MFADSGGESILIRRGTSVAEAPIENKMARLATRDLRLTTMAISACDLSPVQVYLSLKTGENGVRGIFVEQPVLPGTTILQIPLASCL